MKRLVLESTRCYLRRMKSIIILLALFGASLGFAQAPKLPIISLSDFTPGRVWTWNYSQGPDFFSSERYTVMSRDSEFVWIEMSTRLAGETTYRAHHRIHVSVKSCLNAFSQASGRKAWSYEMYYLNNGKWELYDPSSTLAFEEKFNCNPYLFVDRFQPFLTFFYERANGVRLFEQKPWGKLNASRYLMSGPESAIASEKVFAKRDGHDYQFLLETTLQN